MNAEEMSQQWQQSSQQASQAIASWRAAHPAETLAEIEAVVDEQMNRLRAGMIEEVAQASPLEQADAEQQARKCPQCGERMQARGKYQCRLPAARRPTVALDAPISELSRVRLQLFSPSMSN